MDLIKRQAAIDALYDELDMIDHVPQWVYDRLENRIKQLPSAQPEPSTEIQEILDYLDNTLHPIISPDNWNVYSELHDMVSKLPSAQPEIIRCKDCKHKHLENEERKMGVWTREDIVLTSNPPQYQWHCSECGFLARGFSPTKLTNYCPNCGAKMGGEDYEIS